MVAQLFGIIFGAIFVVLGWRIWRLHSDTYHDAQRGDDEAAMRQIFE